MGIIPFFRAQASAMRKGGSAAGAEENMRQMRRLGAGWTLGLAAVAWTAAWGVPPAAAFEGVVKWRTLKVGAEPLGKVAGDATDAAKVFAVPLDTLMKMHGEAKVTEATLYVKGSKVRSESNRAPSYILMDLDAGTTEVVLTEQKKILEVTAEDVDALEARGEALRRMAGGKRDGSQERDDGADSAGPVDFVALDRTETINGFQASAYQGSNAKETVRGWVAGDKPELTQLFEQFQRFQSQMLGRRSATLRPQQALARKGIPVRVQTLDAKTYSCEDLIELRQEPVADDLFVPPAGFTRTRNARLTDVGGAKPAPKP